MTKIKFMKAMMLGMCLSALSTGAVLAETKEGKTEDFTTQIISADMDSDLLSIQSDIDQYVFVDNFEAILDEGFTITHTGPMDSYVEIGISPYSDDNANYLYEIFGTEKIKVVKGVEAILYTTGEAAPEDSMSIQVVNEEMMEKQQEVDDILYSDKPELMATSGLATDDSFTTTVVDENSDQETEEDIMKITSNTDIEEDASDTKNNTLPIVIIGITGIAVLLGGIVILSQKKNSNK